MKRLSFLLLTACVIFLAWWIQKDPGFLLIWYNGLSIEMPLWLGILTIIVMGYVLFRLLSLSDFIKFRSKIFYLKHRIKKEHHLYHHYEQGMLHMMKGHWSKAETVFKEVSEKTESPWLPLLLAGYSVAQQSRSLRQEEDYIRSAAEYLQGDDFVIRLMQARLSLQANRYEEAVAILEHLHEHSPKHDFVLRLLLTAYLHLQDWKHVILLLPRIKQLHLYNSKDFDALEHNVFVQQMKVLAKTSALEEGQALFKMAPKTVRKNAEFIAPFLQILRKNNQNQEAERIARKQLQTTWDPVIVKEYGEILENPSKQLKIAEEWLDSHGPHPWLYLTLGKLAMREKIWGKARHYIEQSLNLEQTPEAYFNLATVLDETGERLRSLEMCKKGLALVLV